MGVEANRAVRRVVDEAMRAGRREDGLMREAAEDQRLDQELGLLRMMMARLVMARLVMEEGDATKQAMAMARLATAAARVVKTQVEVGGGRDTLQEWISEVLKEVRPGAETRGASACTEEA